MTTRSLRSGLTALAIALLLTSPLSSAAAAPPEPGSTSMVSTGLDGVTAGDADSADASISADGRFVAFSSSATNLTPVSPLGFQQVYVRDTLTGEVELVSVNHTTSTQAGNADSFTPSISADGRYVAFVSTAKNLEPLLNVGNYHHQVFVRDMYEGGITRLVSVDHRHTDGGWGHSTSPAISADGSTIAFQSRATDLVAGVTPSETQVYVASLGTEVFPTMRVASLQDSARYPTPELANADAFDPSISGDGRRVTFTSTASNLQAIKGDFQQGFVHDMASGSTSMVTTSVDGKAAGDRSSQRLRISADGEHIAFVSRATNLAGSADGLGSSDQIWVKHLGSGVAPTLVSLGLNGRPSTNDNREPSVSGDGRMIAFVSGDTLVRSDGQGYPQIYVWDSVLGRPALVSTRVDDARQGGSREQWTPAMSADGRFVGFTSISDGLTGTATAPGVAQVYVRALMGSDVDRVGGADRFEVSAGVAADAFPPGTPVVYVAAGQTFADALSGSAAAVKKGGPVLLVSRDSIPATVEAQLRRLTPGAIVVLGGTASISAQVEAALGGFAPSVSRIGGADRYEVSAAVSAATFGLHPEVAYVASGEVFPDALSGSAAAGAAGAPVLLATKTAVPEAVRAELTRLAPKRIVVLGGESTITAATAETLGRIAPVSRIAGADRYEVSAEISRQTSAERRSVVYVASGAVFPDALSGSAAAGADRAPVLLVTKDSIPAAVAAELTRLRPFRIVVLGGPATVSTNLEAQLRPFLVP
ncbi:cell wall-binding repeat-containing protein [Herbiconiux sp. P15]|uniref:cell wall-binding repeat-containing protein n=1 Tax=Herbiconiux liukaitaii TaxID=3342799 RepID=UPI0035B6AD10